MEVTRIEKGRRHATYRITLYGITVGVVYETSYAGHMLYGIWKTTKDGLFPLKYRERSMDAALNALSRAAHLENIE